MGWIHKSDIDEDHVPAEKQTVRHEESDPSGEIAEYLEDRTDMLEDVS